MVTKKKGLIVVAAIIIIAGIVYASRMKGGNKGENNMYHPIGGAYPQSSNTNMQPDSETGAGSCGCQKKRMI